MWTKQKSLILSTVMTAIVFLLVLAATVALPWLMEIYSQMSGVKSYGYVMTALYISAAPGVICTVCLFVLLLNIRKNQVFVSKNIKLLRGISWCCIFVGVVYLILGFEHIWMVLLSFAALFFGLILRVIKNVFEQAIAIREENDFTI